ncbi:MAG: type II toxin-antitoxin system HicB family antitoxin [Synergistaceae bacterium]|jgi:predicted RNase H-like HicB family nuclease|nr:type II toxin-antitoxin system HicB family antitoxin [Synergistaceae bacterium]
MKDRYIYPAAFFWDEDTAQYGVYWPDLPGCVTVGADQAEALRMAKDAMALHLWGMEDDGDDIPAPTEIKGLDLQEGHIAVLVEAFMPPFRERMNNKAVTKAVTVPRWLDLEAKEARLNYSQILQDGLMERLGIRRKAPNRRKKNIAV